MNDDLFFTACEKWHEGKSEEAFRLFLRAAKQGDTSSTVNVGYMYDVGDGVEKDVQQAFKWYKRAWKHNAKEVAGNIATLHKEQGNKRQAIFWWKRALLAGDYDSALQFAKFLLNKKTPRGNREAVEVLELAANAEATREITLAGKEEAEALLATLS